MDSHFRLRDFAKDGGCHVTSHLQYDATSRLKPELVFSPDKQETRSIITSNIGFSRGWTRRDYEDISFIKRIFVREVDVAIIKARIICAVDI